MNRSHDIPANARALLLFGSVARGDPTGLSDVDVLALTDPAQTMQALPRLSLPASVRARVAAGAQLNVVIYSYTELARLAQSGSLFALHLQLEGRRLVDREGFLGAALASPVLVDVDAELADVRRSAAVLYAIDVNPSHPCSYGVARHLARTAVFLACIRAGRPTFSAQQAGVILRRPSLGNLLAGGASPTALRFLALRECVERYAGRSPTMAAPLRALVGLSRFASQIVDTRGELSYDPGGDAASRVEGALAPRAA